MRVEAGGDRHVRAEDRARAAQQLALGVGEMLGDHRAVQVEVEAVQRPRLHRRLEVGEDQRGEPFEGFRA